MLVKMTKGYVAENVTPVFSGKGRRHRKVLNLQEVPWVMYVKSDFELNVFDFKAYVLSGKYY